jgi:ABC-2 type transport system permease protein
MSTSAELAPARRSALQGFLLDTRVIARRNIKSLIRTPQIVVFASLQPVIFVLLFRYVFGGSIHVPGYRSYADYLIPGIVVQTTVFGGSSLTVRVAEDMSKGITDRFRSLPMSRTAILAGATIASVARTTFTLILVTFVGIAVGFRFHTPATHIALAFLVALAFGYAFAWFFTLVGILVRSTEAAQLAAFLPIFPLVFAASTFTSPKTMPSWLRAFADNQPITQVVDSIRALTQGIDPATAPTLRALAWSAGILIVCAFASVRRFRTV